MPLLTLNIPLNEIADADIISEVSKRISKSEFVEAINKMVKCDFTVKEAASYLNVTPKTIYNLVSEGKLNKSNPKSFTRDDLDRYKYAAEITDEKAVSKLLFNKKSA